APDLAMVPPCEKAAAEHSSLGCEFWATSTLHSEIYAYFDFGLVAVNPASAPGPATVTIERAGAMIVSKAIAPGATAEFVLPWIDSVAQLETCDVSGCTSIAATSVLATDAAYHVVSDAPVGVYQLSPIQAEKPLSP